MSQTTYLLDTNILLAAVIEPAKLPATAIEQLSNPNNVILFSAASIYEIGIKRSLNKDYFDFMPQDIHRLAIETGFTELPIQSEHCFAVAQLPWHHRDPFDRLLIAQAQFLPAYLLTTDSQLVQYSDLVMHTTLR